MRVLLMVFVIFVAFAKSYINDNEDDNIPGRFALENFPVIDGHNDLVWVTRSKVQNKLSKFPFTQNLTDDPIFGEKVCDMCHTDLPKLKAGKVGGQFWSAYIKCSDKNALREILEQIDVIKRFVRKYPQDLQFATSSNEILEAIANKKIASLIGVEGGQTLENKLSVLRMFYDLGVRYVTLTHTCNTDWADASPVDIHDKPVNDLTIFGEKIVLEMNRLGMLVDLSHVSYGVMKKTLNVTLAPVIFSHSSAYAVHNHHRNVRDDILEKLKENRGIIMVNFYPSFIRDVNVSVIDVSDHVNHIVDVCGIDCVGLGGDYNGITKTAKGLEDVSKYPNLFDYLKKTNSTRWTISNLEKLAGRNLIRVFQEVEKVKENLRNSQPDETWFEDLVTPTGEGFNIKLNIILMLILGLFAILL